MIVFLYAAKSLASCPTKGATMHANSIYLQSDFDALAMAIEDGMFNDDDPRAWTIVDAARIRGLAPAALEVFTDPTAPTPVRERAFAAIAGRVLASA